MQSLQYSNECRLECELRAKEVFRKPLIPAPHATEAAASRRAEFQNCMDAFRLALPRSMSKTEASFAAARCLSVTRANPKNSKAMR